MDVCFLAGSFFVAMFYYIPSSIKKRQRIRSRASQLSLAILKMQTMFKLDIVASSHKEVSRDHKNLCLGSVGWTIYPCGMPG